MKLRYIGGHIEKVKVRDPKTNRYVVEERDQIAQLFEETMYEFPKPGSVMTVPSGVGGWLLGKLGKFLEVVDEPPETRVVAAGKRITAVIAEEVKAPPPAQPTEKKSAPPATQGSFAR